VENAKGASTPRARSGRLTFREGCSSAGGGAGAVAGRGVGRCARARTCWGPHCYMLAQVETQRARPVDQTAAPPARPAAAGASRALKAHESRNRLSSEPAGDGRGGGGHHAD
jgi:hypothetical protein